MGEHRGTAFVLVAFAVSLAALGAGAGAGYARCGGGEDCSYELALSIFAIAPAGFIGALTMMALRPSAGLAWLRTLLLIAGAGSAVAPLAVFLLGDVWFVPVVAAMIAGVLYLILQSERDERQELQEQFRAARAATPRRPAEPEPVPVEPTPAPPAPEPVALPRISAADFAAQVAALDGEVARLADALREMPEPRRPRVRLHLLDQQPSL